MIDADDIRKVREATDLVALVGERVVLKQRGREFWGCCPFHNEKTPSFKLDPATQLFHCFGCGEGGDAIGFLMKSENLEFIDAITILAERANIELQHTGTALDKGKRARLYEVCEKTAEFYHYQLMRVKSPASDAARAYLTKRDFGGDIPKEWLIGYAPGRGMLVKHLTKLGYTRDEMLATNVASERTNHQVTDRFYDRIMFPIYDLRGKVIAFGGRTISSSKEVAKYINSSETFLFHKRENLFAIDKAKAAITNTGRAVVVEGYTDVIAMHQAGFTNTVATLGTALTPQHIKLLKRFAKTILYLFDGDRAGLAAADKAATLITTELGAAGFESMDFLVATLPEGLDPADMCKNEGPEKLQAVLDGAKPLIQFSLDLRLSGFDKRKPEECERALKEALMVLLPLRGSLLAEGYLDYLTDFFSVEGKTIRATFNSIKAPRSFAQASGADEVGSDIAIDPAVFAGFERQRGYERELLIYAVKFPHVRRMLGEAFSRISFEDDLHATVASTLMAGEAWIDEPPAELTSRIIAAIPEAASLLAAGLTQINEDDALMHARILMFSLREEQLSREVASLKAKHRRLELGQSAGQPAGQAAPAQAASAQTAQDLTAQDLFSEIAKKQQELNDVRKRFAELPKMHD
ncbi:MAG: DNA primase [Coriobacteriales bacterium]|nr:DNA primase [Coriobacteriales bacterium]